MSASSSQRRVQQRTQVDIKATKSRTENRQVLLEQNVVRADVMVAPFSFIDEMIQENHWQFLTTAHALCILD